MLKEQFKQFTSLANN